MPGASGANAVLAYQKEATYGLTPTTGAYQLIRFVSEDLQQNTGTLESNEIDPGRQVTDVTRSSLSAGGTVNAEISNKTYKDWWEWLLQADATWAVGATVIAAGSVDMVSATTEFTAQTTFTNAPNVGDWVRVSGMDLDVNNGLFKVATVTSNTSFTVHNNSALADESAATAVTITVLDSITNGKLFASMSILKEFEEDAAVLPVDDQIYVYRGSVLGTGSVSAAIEQKVTGSFGILAAQEVSYTDANDPSTAGGRTAVPGTRTFGTVEDMSALLEGNTEYPMQSFAFTADNGLRAQLEMGILGAIGIGSANFRVTGSHTALFKNKTVMQKYRDFTETSLEIGMLDSNGDGLVYELPAMHYTAGRQVSGGNNEDVLADMEFAAKKHGTLGYTLKIWRTDTA